jgi:magnesium-transporting ATPase (P-type)
MDSGQPHGSVGSADTEKWEQTTKRWHQVKVGDVVLVQDLELFPADLMCLHCDLEERICYVKTTNLDGETNLKVKRCDADLLCLQFAHSKPVPPVIASLLFRMCDSICAVSRCHRLPCVCRQVLDEEFYPDGWSLDSLLDLNVEVECEMPNSNLHSFRGKVKVSRKAGQGSRVMPIAMNQMLLRGCLLKNSHSILGLVVYAGRETRIQMNSAAAPLKVGAFDHFLNMQVAILIMGQIGLCVLCAVINYGWRETEVRHAVLARGIGVDGEPCCQICPHPHVLWPCCASGEALHAYLARDPPGGNTISL